MTSSLLFLSLVILLAKSSGGVLLVVAHGNGAGLTHIHLYMHKTFLGPNATTMTVVPSRLGGNASFGAIGVLDNDLRDGPDLSNSSLVGRFQGIFAFAGLASPPGMQSVTSFVFTAGEHNGSTLAMVGTIMSFEGDFERAVVGGTGAFRMARGYCVMKTVSTPTPESMVNEVNLFVKMDD
ncbi:unnamed protein product [Alopecurus aequalis]